MTKDQLISLIKKILGTDIDLKFLAKLDLAELELLVLPVRVESTFIAGIQDFNK